MADIGTTPQYTTPEDYKSGLADILKEAKNIYEAKKAAGFQTYGAPRIAGFSPEELAAMSGIAGLVGAGQQYFAPAAGLTAGLAQQFTPATAQQYMSPYQQAVIDVEKREAIRQSQRPMQDISAAAVGYGGMGGSRQAILEAEAQRNLQQQLGDIQTKGQQAAYQTGLQAFESQKARERAAASGLASLGQIAPRQQLAELTALSGIGEAQRGMTQSGLDIAYQDFMKQQQYPYDLLGQYQSTLYGYPYQAYSQQTYTPYQKPSSFQQMAGVLGALGKVGGSSGFGFFNTGGKIAYQSGGGLSGLTKKLQGAGPVGEELTMDEDTFSKASLIKSLMNMQSGLSEYGTALKESLEEQQRIAKEKQERLQKQASPINYISDILLGYSQTDPRAGLGVQLGEAATYAQEQRDVVQNELDKLAADVAAGRLTQAEAQLKMQQLQTETLSDVVDVLGGTDVEASDVNALRRLAADRVGVVIDAEGNIKGSEEQAKKAAKLFNDLLTAYQSGGWSAAGVVLERGLPAEIDVGDSDSDTDSVTSDNDAALEIAEEKIQSLQ